MTSTRREFAHAAEVLAAVAIVALALIAFSPALSGPYLWDDKTLIPGNLHVREMNVRAWFTRDFWDVGAELQQATERLRYYRPLVTASYAVEFRLGGGDPLLLHLSNLLAHAAASVLALFTLRRWTRALLPAFVGALLFALHPTKAESVAWIAGRTDVLCAIAVFVAALGAARRLRKLPGGVALECVGTAVAYLTKEGAVVLPALVAVEAWVALERPAIDRATIKRVALAAAPHVVVAAVYLAARAALMPLRPVAPPTPLADHLPMIFESIGRYCALIVAPVNLSGQHGLLLIADGRILHSWSYVAVGVVATLALSAVAFAMRRRAPAVAVALLLFFVLLIPVSNVMLAGLGTLIAERFLYLPLLAIAWLVAEGVAAIRTWRAAAVAITILFAPLSFMRALDFSDELRFWTREHRLHPESLEAHRVLMAHARGEKRYREAAAHALAGREQAARYHQHTGSELEFLHHYLEMRALLTPDRDTARLEALARFYRALLDPSATVAEVRTPGIEVVVPLGKSTLANRARSLETRTRVVLAELSSRLGRDGEARTLADAAQRACPTCAQAVHVAAMVAARAGDYANANRLLDDLAKRRGEESVAALRKSLASAETAGRQARASEGPSALQLRAIELAQLDSYGRAYATLAPYREQIEVVPGFAIGFAELAYRAGEEAVARDVLQKHVPEEKIGGMFDAWAEKMGWR